MIKKILLLTLLLNLYPVVWAQTCSDTIFVTAPDSRYRDNSDGTITDLQSGLIWKQCSQGLSGSDCSSGAVETKTWQQALQAADTEQFAGYDDWRLPNLSELASLVEMSCYSPAINDNYFPNTENSYYWSSSPCAPYSPYAWYVGFYSGNDSSGNKDSNGYVRLVRGGQALPFLSPVPKVSLLSENLQDGVMVTGTNRQEYTQATKQWSFRNGNVAISGLKAVMVSADSDLVSTDYVSGSEISIGDVSVDGAFLVELPIRVKGGGSEVFKESVWKLVDGSGETVKVGNSDTFWVKLRTNHPPQFSRNQPLQVAGMVNSDLILDLIAVDADGDTLSYSIVSGSGASINGNRFSANYNDGQIHHTITVAVSDGLESSESTIDVLTFTEGNVLDLYADVDGSGAHDDYIAYATLQGLVVGNAESGTRNFYPDDQPSWSEMLAMVVGAAAYHGAVTIPTDALLKAPGPVPVWVDPYYTTARLLNGLDVDTNLAAAPTNEAISRLMVTLLGLKERVSELGLEGDLPQFSAPLCASTTQQNCFSSADRLYEAQLVHLHGLFMRDTSVNPQDLVTRAQLTEVMSRMMLMPSATLNMSASIVEKGDSLSVTLDHLRAPVIQQQGSFVMVDALQPDPAQHTTIEQIRIGSRVLQETPVEMVGFSGYVIDSSELDEGYHTLTFRLKNGVNDIYSYIQTPFEVSFTDGDYDGVQDIHDLWPNNPLFTEDQNGNGIPDFADLLWGLELADSTTPVYVDGVSTYSYGEAILNGYEINGLDDDYDGVVDSKDPYPLDATRWSEQSGGGGGGGTDSFDPEILGSCSVSSNSDAVLVSQYYSLKSGWNLLGIPLLPNEGALQELAQLTGVESIWRYDGTAGWKFYISGQTAINSLSSLEAGKGYWVYVSEEASDLSFTLQGQETSGHPSWAIGWNLVGITAANTVPSELLTNTQSDAVWGWKKGRGGWQSYVDGVPVFLNSLQQLDQEAGYYIHAQQATAAINSTGDGWSLYGIPAYEDTDYRGEPTEKSITTVYDDYQLLAQGRSGAHCNVDVSGYQGFALHIEGALVTIDHLALDGVEASSTATEGWNAYNLSYDYPQTANGTVQMFGDGAVMYVDTPANLAVLMFGTLDADYLTLGVR